MFRLFFTTVLKNYLKNLNKSLIMKLFTLSFLFLLCTSCSGTKTPAFYPNDHLNKVGDVQAEVDRKYCQALADQYVKDPNRYSSTVKEGTISGALGAATGAVAGAITQGNIGRSIGAGAAVAAIWSIASDLRRTDNTSPTYQRFVERCLKQKGYKIVGWN